MENVKKIDTPSEIENIDRLIRDGQVAKAREALGRLEHTKLRDSLGLVAWLAWRVDLPELGLRVLFPAIKRFRDGVPLGARERAEYASCLIRIGAAHEASELLAPIPIDEYPQAALYRCFANFHQWKYAEAIPVLREYLKHPSLTPYQRMVGLANLASALVYERKEPSASHALSKLIRGTGEQKLNFLQATAARLAAVNLLYQGKLGEAARYLDRAAKLLAGAQGLEPFFVEKWRAVLSLLREPGQTALGELDRIRREGDRLRHWETRRDCDRFAAIATRDERLFLHVYYGTPHAKFRERLAADFGAKGNLPATHMFGPAKPKHTIDVTDERAWRGSAGARPSRVVYRFIAALARDRYQPLRAGTLFIDLFPGEHFNPNVSVRRIHEAARRARAWLEENAPGSTIESGEAGYSLRLGEDVALLTALTERGVGRDPALAKLRRKFGKTPFTAPQAAEVLETSVRSAQRALKPALDGGGLVATGLARAKRYRFPT